MTDATPPATPPDGRPADAPAPPTAEPKRSPPSRVRIVRWEGVIPLVLAVVLAVVAWRVALPRLLAATASEALTKVLGTQVDVDSVSVAVREARLRIGRVQIADPFDTTHNVVELGPVVLDLRADALLSKKVVVESLVVDDGRWRVRRAVPARPIAGASFARTVLGEAREFADRLRTPPLRLLPLDTVRSLVLDPAQLQTVQAAVAVRRTADSLESALTARMRAIDAAPIVDSVKALGERLRGASPRSLGIAGTQAAVRDLRALQRRLEALRRSVDTLVLDARAGADTLGASLRRVDDARRRDEAFARSLLQLPTFDGPDFSGALFGPLSIARFEQAVYYARLAERWLPAGLKPRETEGPVRRRLAGTTVHFPTAERLPQFLLKRAEVRFAIPDPSGAAARYRLVVGDVTSDPSVLGRPIVALARRDAAAASGLAELTLRGVVDHLGAVPRDSVVGVASGIALPDIPLPGLPLRLDPGAGRSGFVFVRRGESIAGVFELASSRLAWQVDSAALAGGNVIERAVVEVLRGIPELRVRAELGGSLEAPTLRVSSNFDALVAARIRGLVGAEVARAEARARAAVEREVGKAQAEVRARVAAVRADGERRVEALRLQIEAERRTIEERLRALGAGALGLPG